MDLVVEVAQLLAQFGVSRLTLVLEARLAILISPALVLPTNATSASSCAVFAARKLRFHCRSDAALLDRPLRIPPQFNQLRKRRKAMPISDNVSQPEPTEGGGKKTRRDSNTKMAIK